MGRGEPEVLEELVGHLRDGVGWGGVSGELSGESAFGDGIG